MRSRLEAGCGCGGDAGVAEMWRVEAAAEERYAHCVIVTDWSSRQQRLRRDPRGSLPLVAHG